MAFETDVFISYAHQDNQGEVQWVAALEDYLKAYLGQSYHRQPIVWRDQRLTPNKNFDQEIANRLLASATMVCVVSPRYVDSDYCSLERETFLEHAGDADRVFKVVTWGLPDHTRHPPPLDRENGFQFFEVDESTGHSYELNPDDEGRSTYRRLVQDLARHIATELAELEGGSATVGAGKQSDAPPVYLAFAGHDRKRDREEIARDLEVHGFEVRPRHHVANVHPECEAEIRGELEGCALAIHIVGSYSGGVPDGPTDDSFTEIQSRLAGEAGVRRLHWIPAEPQSEDVDYREFVERLRDDPATHENGDLYTGSLEQLKTAILDELAPATEPASTEPAPAHDGPSRIYLLYAPGDREAASPLDDFLYDDGYEVLHPFFEDGRRNAALHVSNLKAADGVLIFHRSGGPGWWRRELNEMDVVAVAKAVYVAPENDGERVRSREAVVIPGGAAFSPDSLQPFLRTF